MTSSSKRVIKRPEASGTLAIEDYLLPVEQFVSSQVVLQAPVFPQYTNEGEKKAERKIPFKEIDQAQETQQKDGSGEPAEQDEFARERQMLEQWKQEESRLLEEARQKAVRILDEAQKEAREQRERAAEEGRREGYAQGYEEGRRQAEGEFRNEIEDHLLEFQEDMRKALDAVDTARKNCLHTYLEELKDCAIAIGEKVIHISLRSSGEVIKQMIISATEKLKKTAWVKIYMDKYDYDMMMEADAGVIDELSHLSDNIKFIVMDKEDRGSCIIEMPEEIVDVSVNTQIENIKDILENIRI